MKTATITVTYRGYVCRTCKRRMDIGDTMVMPDTSDHWHCVDCAMAIAAERLDGPAFLDAAMRLPSLR